MSGLYLGLLALIGWLGSMDMAEAMARSFGGAAFNSCPIGDVKQDFEPEKFYGDWFAQEYIYGKPMPNLKTLSCVGFHYSSRGYGDLQTNFTMQFPPRTGHVYHIPTFSIVDTANNAMWETKLRDRHTVTLVLETDYTNLAIMVECQKLVDGSTEFLSTRILSRSHSIPSEEIELINGLIDANEAGHYSYKIDQAGCEKVV